MFDICNTLPSAPLFVTLVASVEKLSGDDPGGV